MIKKLLLAVLVIVNIVCVSYIYYISSKEDDSTSLIKEVQQSVTIDSYIDRKIVFMSVQEKRGALFMVSIPDSTLSQDTIKYLKDNHIYGVILFSNNVQSETQLKQLTTDLRDKVDKRLFIAIDQEGGSVLRISWDNYSDVSARETGNKNDLNYTKEIADYRAKLLKDLRINMLLGPVADVADGNSFMYSRTFSSNPDKVADNVEQTVKSNQEEKVLSAIKHFPGHGRTTTDSHQDFPVINLKIDQLQSHEFVPFKAGIDSSAELVMLGHIINPQIDADNPASMSFKYVEILEKDLGFEGVVITDDLKMTGQINGGIDWGINLDAEPQQDVIRRMGTIEPQDKYVRKVLELKYKKL